MSAKTLNPLGLLCNLVTAYWLRICARFCNSRIVTNYVRVELRIGLTRQHPNKDMYMMTVMLGLGRGCGLCRCAHVAVLVDFCSGETLRVEGHEVSDDRCADRLDGNAADESCRGAAWRVRVQGKEASSPKLACASWARTCYQRLINRRLVDG
jgi:hypothetical protein